MAFTEFFCNAASGANINAGSTTGAATVTSTNGDWGNAAANRFTAAAGTPFSGVAVGDFASVYLDGATTAVYIARVTAINAGGASIDVSSTAKSGTAPTTGATGRSCTVGGAWKGPNAAENFPFGFVEAALTNAAGDMPRVNLKNNATYNVTNSVTHGVAGPVRFQGCSSTPGDGGRAVIDGGTTGASYTVLSLSAGLCHLFDCEITHNGATGATGAVNAVASSLLQRVVVHDVRGAGFNCTTSQPTLVECEAYNCNQGAFANTGAFHFAAGGTIAHVVRCIAHDNGGSTDGFRFTSSNAGLVNLINCIADSNGGKGIIVTVTTGARAVISGCDCYNNGSDGLTLDVTTAGTGSGLFYVLNSNFVKNGGYGIQGTSSGRKHGLIQNCGFGGGGDANTSGQTATLDQIEVSSSISYSSHPYQDPANGDFRIAAAAAKQTGVGSFLQSQGGYSGTVGYPDVGAAQAIEAGTVYVPIVRYRTKTRTEHRRSTRRVPIAVQNTLIHPVRKVR